MNVVLYCILAFVAGGVAVGVTEYFVLRNNPQIVKKLEEDLAKVKGDAAKYREAYEELLTKIKLKANDK